MSAPRLGLAPALGPEGRIVVASSDGERRSDLVKTLEIEGHQVTEATTAAQTIRRACSNQYDLLLMDSLVEGVSAHLLCRAIRPDSRLAIVVLEREGGSTAVDVLNAGADDFIAGPPAMLEIAAHIRAMLRRVAPRRGVNRVVLHDRVINLAGRCIEGPGAEIIPLSPKEFLVLQFLILHANESSTREQLASIAWRKPRPGQAAGMRTLVNRLRHKIEADPNNPVYLITERSIGYTFRPPESAGQPV